MDFAIVLPLSKITTSLLGSIKRFIIGAAVGKEKKDLFWPYAACDQAEIEKFRQYIHLKF